jgi:hypothetical protein
MFQWFILPKPTIATDGIYMFGTKLAWGKTIHFKNP